MNLSLKKIHLVHLLRPLLASSIYFPLICNKICFLMNLLKGLVYVTENFQLTFRNGYFNQIHKCIIEKHK